MLQSNLRLHFKLFSQYKSKTVTSHLSFSIESITFTFLLINLRGMSVRNDIYIFCAPIILEKVNHLVQWQTLFFVYISAGNVYDLFCNYSIIFIMTINISFFPFSVNPMILPISVIGYKN